MKRLIMLAFALMVATSLLAQDTGGDKNHKGKTTTAATSDHDHDHDKEHKGGKKGHKGGKKSKKGASTTPPPK